MVMLLQLPVQTPQAVRKVFTEFNSNQCQFSISSEQIGHRSRFAA
jgi:hypothetical protein